MKVTLESNNKNENIEIKDRSVEAEDQLPAWLQLFLERTDSIKIKAKTVEQESTENDTPNENIEATGTVDEYVVFNDNLGPCTDQDKFLDTDSIEKEKSINQSDKDNKLKSKISKLKNIFNLQNFIFSNTNQYFPKVFTSDLL